ncbi:MAG: hypothetical protein JXJ20_09645 [Anaerolineae bacterium]|nr:hypothetical protein [Anaerolineae bacterium]
MDNWLLAIVIGMAFGLLIGIKIARDSNAEAPVRGGALASALHYLACAGMASMLPFIITGLVIGLPFLKLFGTAVGFLVLTGAFLLLYAIFERQTATPSTAQ